MNRGDGQRVTRTRAGPTSQIWCKKKMVHQEANQRQAQGKGQPQSQERRQHEEGAQTTAVEKGGWRSPRKRKERDNGKDNEKGNWERERGWEG
jgi:hypothetical protein